MCKETKGHHWALIIKEWKKNKTPKCHYFSQPTVLMTTCVEVCTHEHRQIREDYVYLIKIITLNLEIG